MKATFVIFANVDLFKNRNVDQSLAVLKMQPKPKTKASLMPFEDPASLLDLPEELLHRIITLLPLSSVYYLGAVCRYLHRIIHQDDSLWQRRVRRRLQLHLVDADLGLEATETVTVHSPAGLVRDPTLQGHKELFLLYSREFQHCVQANQKANATSEFEKIMRYFLPSPIWTRLKSANAQGCCNSTSSRLALFGPGIESPRTKHLVHRIVNAHSSSLNAISFVAGLPGGFGSGVRIDFRQMYTFDLMCLYSNSERVRENERGLTRLLAAHNRLLAKDVDVCSPVDIDSDQWLHDNVLKLLPTLDALVYAVDSGELNADVDQLCKSELHIMLRGVEVVVKHKIIPLLVLCCSNSTLEDGHDQDIDLVQLSKRLDLCKVNRPWAIFKVDIGNMDGLEKSLDWILYHVQKQKADLEYHSSQGRSSSTAV